MRVFTDVFLLYVRFSLRPALIALGVAGVVALLIFASLPKDLFLSQNIPSIKLAVAYEEDDQLASNLALVLEQVEVIESVVITNEENAARYLANGEVDASIVIEDDILDSILSREDTTITVAANDPIKAQVINSLAKQAAHTFDSLQGAFNVFSDATQSTLSSKSNKQSEVIRKFSEELIREALVKNYNVVTVETSEPYLLHAVSLSLFFAVSIGVIVSAIMLSRHYDQGLTRRFFVRGVRFRHHYAALLVLNCLISLLVGILATAILGVLDTLGLLSASGTGVDGVALCLSAVVLGCVLTPLYLMLSGVRLGRSWNSSSQTMLGCLLVLFLLLFAGGGFYPTYLTDSLFTQFNPTFLAGVLTEWSLGGRSASIGDVAVFIMPVVLCSTLFFVQWRRCLR